MTIITTAEELTAQPLETVALGSDGHVWQHVALRKSPRTDITYRPSWQSLTGGGYTFLEDMIRDCAPLTVLYRPDQPISTPGSLHWKFDGGRCAVLDESDTIVGYLSDPPQFIQSISAAPTVEQIEAICGPRCWNPTPCPIHGVDMTPRGRSAPIGYPGCCDSYADSDVNPRHLWDEHDSDRFYWDPSGWKQHVTNCTECEEDRNG